MAHGTPRRLRMNREARLRSARGWLPTYRGHDVVRGYRKWYGVSTICAIVELRMLGVPIDDQRLAQARDAERATARRRAARIDGSSAEDRDFGDDDLWEAEYHRGSELVSAEDGDDGSDNGARREPDLPF